MLSNSLSSAYRMWDAQVEALVPTYRLLRYDTRGHGETSAPPGPYTMDMLTADVIGLLDALDIERCAYCGISMGGMIGQQLGIEHADRFTGLVLANTTSRWPDGAGVLWSGRIRAAQQQGVAALAETTLERWFTEPFLERRSPEYVEWNGGVVVKPSGDLGAGRVELSGDRGCLVPVDHADGVPAALQWVARAQVRVLRHGLRTTVGAVHSVLPPLNLWGNAVQCLEQSQDVIEMTEDLAGELAGLCDDRFPLH